MRNVVCFLSLSLFAGAAAAAAVSAECQREGTTLKFIDGIAFESARDDKGLVTLSIYLTTKPIDRKQLAQCTDCGGELPDNTFMSPRRDWIGAQFKATKGGWLSAEYVGGEMDLLAVHGVDYFAPDGVQNGIAAGNERMSFEVNDGKRLVGTLWSAEGDYWGATCSGRFDIAVGWPQP